MRTADGSTARPLPCDAAGFDPLPARGRGASVPRDRWRAELRAAYRDPAALLDDLGLRADQPGVAAATVGFHFRVPRPFASRMRHRDPRDPLLLQVIPAAAESRSRAGFTTDPVGDLRAQPVPGLLQKYPGRALLLAHGACAIHCRYCFRRHFPYHRTTGPERWRAALAQIRTDPSIAEVILSGGDPLMLGDGQLSELAAAIENISHVRRLRVHTRLPVAVPSRVTDDLLDWLTSSRLRPVIVIHTNHANEIDDEVARALERVRRTKVAIMNQTVLLRGINDDAPTLIDLSERLFDCGVMPYYVHLLDPVDGAGHFDTPSAHARTLASALRAALPGYLVPRFVREIPGMRYKLPVV